MQTDRNLPAAVDVAVVGGGIIGIASAYELARQGARVAVFEKGSLACEQSSRNWGWVRTLLRDPAEIPLAVRSIELWQQIQSQVDVGFRQSGILYLAKTVDDLKEYNDWLSKAGQTDAVMLDAASTLSMLPMTSVDWLGALYSATDGVAEPKMATAGIAALARRHGCQIFEHCAVRVLLQSAGRVTGVHTEHGPVSAKSVLVAGGGWSRLICGNVGVALPQMKVRASVLRASPLKTPLDITLNGKEFTCRRSADGSYVISQFNASYADIVPDSFRLLKYYLPAWLANKNLVKLRFGKRFFQELFTSSRINPQRVSPYEQERVMSPAPSRHTRNALKKLTRAFPEFKNANIQEVWGGYIDVMPDALPVMAQVDRLPGLFVATGFSGHGFGIGPAVGEAMARLIQGQANVVDLRPFSLDRF